MLKEMLARFFSDTPDNIWQKLAELGVIGALFKESNGGYGGSGTDIAVVFEQIGRTANTVPLIDCALIPGYLLAAADRELTPLIAGEQRYAIAHSELNARYDLQSVETIFADGSITGEKTLVVGAQQADHLIVSARENENRLLADALPALEAAWAAAVLAQSADTLGAMDCTAEMTQEYLKTREQFGRPLSTFQALAHRVTDMMLSLEQARSAVSLAATHLEHPPAIRNLHSSACKNLMGRMGRQVAEDSVQLHGGIGMTEEYALGDYIKRIIMADHRFGDTDHHMERYIELSSGQNSLNG